MTPGGGCCGIEASAVSLLPSGTCRSSVLNLASDPSQCSLNPHPDMHAQQSCQSGSAAHVHSCTGCTSQALLQHEAGLHHRKGRAGRSPGLLKCRPQSHVGAHALRCHHPAVERNDAGVMTWSYAAQDLSCDPVYLPTPSMCLCVEILIRTP